MLRIFCLVLLFSGAVCAYSHAADVPSVASKYRADLIRNGRAVWGMDAPTSTFAAQIQQESGWRADALSHVGAQGLSQFMPGTTAWIAGLYPQSLGTAQPFNVAWAMRALVQYDYWLWQRVAAVDDCQRMAKVLSGYNGGLGWVRRDERLAHKNGVDKSVWFDAVERHNAGRSAANFRENRDYPRRILLRHEPGYVAANWGRGVCHD